MEKEVSGKRFFKALNDRDFVLMEELLEADAALHFPKTQPLVGKQRILKFLRLLFRQYPQLVFSIHRIIRQDAFVVVHWSNRGRSRHGELYENEGVTLIELSGRRIRFISDFFKDTEKF
jgi:ketosteroid isomerase-like protein